MIKASGKIIIYLFPLCFSLLCTVLFISWLSYNPANDLILYEPGMDGTPQELRESTSSVIIGQYFQEFFKYDGEEGGNWPRFRGPDYTNIIYEETGLADSWPPEGPPLLWSISLGEGHAGPAVFKGRVYVMDYDETLKADSLRCFSLYTGEEIWRRFYPVIIKRNHGISRTIPTVTEEYTVTMGPKCHVMCVKTGSGDLVWGLDLVEDFGSEVPYWYTAQCPIIDGDKVILAPCGDDLIIAVELATGHILWRIPNPHNCKMSHSSIMPMELNGQKIYIYCAVGGIIGFSDKGEVFWETENWQAQVIAPSPVILVDGKFFVTTGYGAGSMMLQVVANNEGYDIIELYSITPKEGLTCEQHSPIYWNGFLFGVLPREAGYMRNQFVCFHPEGYIQWSSGTENRFGLGPFILADNKFFILDDFGLLTMIEASTTGYNQLGQAKILEGPDAWAPLSITEGLLLARDLNRMVCIDLRDQP